jgi:hypothetical protein
VEKQAVDMHSGNTILAGSPRCLSLLEFQHPKLRNIHKSQPFLGILLALCQRNSIDLFTIHYLSFYIPAEDAHEILNTTISFASFFSTILTLTFFVNWIHSFFAAFTIIRSLLSRTLILPLLGGLLLKTIKSYLPKAFYILFPSKIRGISP